VRKGLVRFDTNSVTIDAFSHFSFLLPPQPPPPPVFLFPPPFRVNPPLFYRFPYCNIRPRFVCCPVALVGPPFCKLGTKGGGHFLSPFPLGTSIQRTLTRSNVTPTPFFISGPSDFPEGQSPLNCYFMTTLPPREHPTLGSLLANPFPCARFHFFSATRSFSRNARTPKSRSIRSVGKNNPPSQLLYSPFGPHFFLILHPFKISWYFLSGTVPRPPFSPQLSLLPFFQQIPGFQSSYQSAVLLQCGESSDPDKKLIPPLVVATHSLCAGCFFRTFQFHLFSN